MRATLFLAFVLAISSGCGASSAPPAAPSDAAKPQAAPPQEAFVQSDSPTDIGIRERIRERIVASDLSAEAQNVSVVTQGGKVMLSGAVKSKGERTKVVDFANDVAGAENVACKLEVLPSSSSTDKEITIRLE